jgi:hypothetical protein
MIDMKGVGCLFNFAATTAAATAAVATPYPQTQNVLAKKVIERVPSVEMVRFVSSGTEACLSVLRLMRAYTKREKVGLSGCQGGGEACQRGDAAWVPASVVCTWLLCRQTRRR